MASLERNPLYIYLYANSQEMLNMTYATYFFKNFKNSMAQNNTDILSLY